MPNCDYYVCAASTKCINAKKELIYRLIYIQAYYIFDTICDIILSGIFYNISYLMLVKFLALSDVQSGE